MGTAGRVQGQVLGSQIPAAQGKSGQKGGAAQIEFGSFLSAPQLFGQAVWNQRRPGLFVYFLSSFLAKGDQSQSSALPSSPFLLSWSP